MDISKSTCSSSSGTSPPAKRSKSVIPGIVTGTHDFQRVAKSTAFVDKTMLVKEFVNSSDTVILITCPRRFGKSTNMSMLATFLEIEANDEGKAVPGTKTKNYKCFKDLEIGEDKNFIEEHCGQYPVISVSFLGIQGRNDNEILNGVKTALHKAFKQHEYMVNVYDNTLKKENLKRLEKKKTESYLNKFERYIDEEEYKKLDNEDVRTGLQWLSELLHKHFGKKAYLLIDEYDALVHGAIENNLNPKEAQALTDGILCAALKDNEYLERGLLTGISSMVRGSSGSRFNNATECKFLQDSNNFVTYYGFTEDEVLKLSLSENLKISTDMQKQMKEWYNGYYAKGQGLNIYNPSSIVQSIRDRNCQGYWNKSGAINNILGIFKVEDIRKKIEELIADQVLEFQLDKLKAGLDLTAVENLKDMLNSKDKILQQHIDLFFSYIFELGYLSPTEKENCYKVPNEEIKQEFKQNIVNYYLETYSLRKDDLERSIKQLDLLLCNIDAVDTSGFEQSLNTLFAPLKLAKISDPDQPGIQSNEDLYHSIVNVIAIQSKKGKFGTEVQTKKKTCEGKKGRTDEGRIDIVLVNDEVHLGMIIELKHAGSAGEALKQAQKYEPIFSSHTNIKKIKYIGMNVDMDKKVTIAHELVDNPNYQNPPGEGLSAKDNLYKLPYYKSFNEYHSRGIAEILQLRINKLSIDRKILILYDIEYQLTKSDTGTEKILRDLIPLNLKGKEIILLPYNIENKHWVGLMVIKNNGELQARYVDPENNPIPEVLLLDLQSQANKLNIRINISQIIVEQQKYNNCGPEVIENFILLLTGSRLTQEETVPFHSQLVEDDLLRHTDLNDCNVETLKDNSKMKY